MEYEIILWEGEGQKLKLLPQHPLTVVFIFSQRLHAYFKVFLPLYKFNIQIKLKRLVLSTYEECRMHIDTSFHPQCRDISQVATYDHRSHH